MTEHTDQPLTGGSKEDRGTPDAVPASGKKRRLYLAGGAALLLIALAAGGYVLWQTAVETRQISRAVHEASARQAEMLRATLGDLESRLVALEEKQFRLETEMATLGDDWPANNEDWALAEIEYLLIIAMHRLLLEHDVVTALAAMDAAELRLRDLGNPRLIPVRAQLTADINRLRAVNTIDITGMALYMADLIERLESFPLKAGIEVAGGGERNSAGAAENDAGWRGLWKSFWGELKSVVVITRHDGPVETLLLPHQEYFLYQNLRIELESARLSILRRDTENLKTSLGMLTDWLNRYFDTQDTGVANVLETLDHMASVELDPELPDISSSIESLRAYLRASELQEGPPDRAGESPPS